MPPARFSLPPRTVSTEPAPTVRTVPRADSCRGAPSPPDHHPTTTWGRRQSHQAVVPEGTIGQSVSARGRPVATLSVHIAAASTREVQLWSRVGAGRSCRAPRCYVPAADSCSGGSTAAREPGSVAGPRRARRHLAHQLPNPPGPQLASRPASPIRPSVPTAGWDRPLTQPGHGCRPEVRQLSCGVHPTVENRPRHARPAPTQGEVGSGRDPPRVPPPVQQPRPLPPRRCRQTSTTAACGKHAHLLADLPSAGGH